MTRNGSLDEMHAIAGWNKTTLGGLASETGCFIQTGPFGSQLHKHDYQDDGVGVVNPTHLTGNGVVHDNVPRISAETASRLERHRLSVGDILFARRGEIGRHGLVTSGEQGWLCGTGCFLVRIRRDDLDNQFLSYFISTPEAVEWLNRHAAGVVMPNLNNTVLHELPINLPPLPEQRKIAGVLGVVQRAMEQQERLLALTAELKKALLHQLFTAGLRGEPQKQSEIGPVPESWEVVQLQDICTFLSGGTPSKQTQEFWSGSIPWVSPKDMKKPRLVDVVDHISEAALEDGSSLAPAGSVFIVIRGMILAKDVPVALAEVPMAFNQDMKAIIPRPRVVPSFLLYGLVALKGKLFQKVGRSAHGTMTLMSHDIAQLSIPVPDRKTQEEIAASVFTVERKYDCHRRKHAALTALFRTLLHQLMTAQIRVHELDLPELEAATQA